MRLWKRKFRIRLLKCVERETGFADPLALDMEVPFVPAVGDAVCWDTTHSETVIGRLIERDTIVICVRPTQNSEVLWYRNHGWEGGKNACERHQKRKASQDG